MTQEANVVPFPPQERRCHVHRAYPPPDGFPPDCSVETCELVKREREEEGAIDALERLAEDLADSLVQGSEPTLGVLGSALAIRELAVWLRSGHEDATYIPEWARGVAAADEAPGSQE